MNLFIKILDYLYHISLSAVNRKEDGDSIQRAHRAVIIMSAMLIAISISTIVLFFSFFIEINKTGPVFTLAIAFITSTIIYKFLYYFFIRSNRYILIYDKKIHIKNAYETLLITYSCSFAYFIIINYIAGHLR